MPLLANLGAVQLNYGMGVDECRRAVEMIGADALVLHLNPLQEALQPEGQRNFSGAAAEDGRGGRARWPSRSSPRRSAAASRSGSRRRLAGAGRPHPRHRRLRAARAGRASRRRAPTTLELGELFAGWGIPTPQSIQEVARRSEGVTVIGSGGLRNGLDVAKAIALGADLAGMAYPFLAAATESAGAGGREVRRIVHELKICMFCLGVKNGRGAAHRPSSSKRSRR